MISCEKNLLLEPAVLNPGGKLAFENQLKNTEPILEVGGTLTGKSEASRDVTSEQCSSEQSSIFLNARLEHS